MYNPLIENPSKLKDQDLEKKILDLSRKYHVAMRLGQGGLAQQIVVTLDAYRMELQDRQANAMKIIQEKQEKQGLDDLINVDR
jgi:hypothetical protein